MKKNITLLLVFTINIFAAISQNGLVGEYYDGVDFNKKIATRTDDKIDFYWDFKSPMNGMNPESFSIRWTGKLRAPESGQFIIGATVDDGMRVWINNQPVINAWDLHDKVFFSNYIYLEKGNLYDIKVEYYNGMREGMIHLKWQLPSEKPIFRGLAGNNQKVIDKSFFSNDAPPVAMEKVPRIVKTTKNDEKDKKKVEKIVKVEKNAPVVLENQIFQKRPTEDTLMKYTPKNILFAQSSTTMIGDSQQSLDRLAAMLLRYPNLKVSIEGHTDNVGDVALNYTLSEKRANTVRDYLIQKNVAASRLSAKGFGGSRPIFKDSSDKNRRVAFVFL
jgi:outer membrane protein OmpA-like peptidoglycan-associated protein